MPLKLSPQDLAEIKQYFAKTNMAELNKEFNYQKKLLEKLAVSQPQTLLIEGGSEDGRNQLALYWAKIFNCPEAAANKSPCLLCPVCKQISALEYLDLLVYDGRISNKADEENPGPVKSLRKNNIDNLKQVLGTAPRGKGKRIIVFSGMSQTREEAMNSLLKTLEEPAKGTLFVLLTPHREQILPTLVSRAHCFTLPWIYLRDESQNNNLEEEAAKFIQTGHGFLDAVSAKGAIDAQTADKLILACQLSLLDAYADSSAKNLTIAFRNIVKTPQKGFLASQWLEEAQAMLSQTVSPQRVLEALFTKLFLLCQNNQNLNNY